MEAEYKGVRAVSGMFFSLLEEPVNPIDASGDNKYLLFLNNRAKEKDTGTLFRFIRMFAIPYRLALICDRDREIICYILSVMDDESEDVESAINWAGHTHPGWEIINCQKAPKGVQIPMIMGYRLARNPFHAGRLKLQGEILEDSKMAESSISF